MRNIFLTCLIVFVSTAAIAQERKTDTVKVLLAKTSQVIFTMKDRSDLETLKHYDFQNLFQDILTKLEKTDTSALKSDSTQSGVVNADEDDEGWRLHRADRNNDTDGDDHENWNRNEHRNGHHGRTSQTFSFDLGTNNFLSNGKFPDNTNEKYSVRPWGSWYVSMASIQRTRLSKKFFLEWGGGISWYNFKFQDDNVLIQKDDNGVQFVDDPRSTDPAFDFTKSKLTATYINASLIPVIDFGGSSHKPHAWDGHGDSFRIGLGPYIGYRIDSYSKQVFTENGDKKKDHNHDSFYLNNIRYGARFQIGFRSTDLFFNYDMNELFTSGKGPSLNAFSFGVIF